MASKFLIHAKDDFVGVATEDISKGEKVEGVFMDTLKKFQIEARDNVPLGHKIALKEMKKGDKVIEYGEPIGEASQNINAGAHVHVHNIKSMRW